jgi:hypothetical protein
MTGLAKPQKQSLNKKSTFKLLVQQSKPNILQISLTVLILNARALCSIIFLNEVTLKSLAHLKHMLIWLHLEII